MKVDNHYLDILDRLNKTEECDRSIQRKANENDTRLAALETVCERQSKRIREMQAQVARLEKLVASHASHGRVEVL